MNNEPEFATPNELIGRCSKANDAIENAFVDNVEALCGLAQNLVRLYQIMCRHLSIIEGGIGIMLYASRQEIAKDLVRNLGSHVVGKECLSEILIETADREIEDDMFHREVSDQVWRRCDELLHGTAKLS